VTFGVTMPVGAFEPGAGKELEQLGENAAYSIGGGTLTGADWFREKLNPNWQRFRPIYSIAILDKRGACQVSTAGGVLGRRAPIKIKSFQSLTQITPVVLLPSDRLLLSAARPILTVLWFWILRQVRG